MQLFDHPATVAINDVVRAARESADLYADGADRLADQEVAKLFLRIAAARRKLAADLAGILSERDELPLAPDPDAEALHQLLNAARSRLAADPDRTLIDDRRRAEQSFRELLEAAEHQEVPVAAKRRFEEELARVSRVCRWLDRAAGD